MSLFNRKIKVEIGRLTLTESAVNFRIERSLKKEPNSADITVFNLAKATRDDLENNPSWRNADSTIPVSLFAGYGDELTQLFTGDLDRVTHRKQAPDWLTEISGGDGEKGFKRGRAAVGYRVDTSVETVVKDLAKRIGVGLGNVRKAIANRELEAIGQAFTNGFAGNGSAQSQLDRLLRGAGLEYSIQDGELQVIPVDGSLGNDPIKLTPTSGLVGVPEVDNEGKLRARALLQPDLRPGEKVSIESESATGVWTIQSVVYSGSSAVGAPDFYVDIEGKA